LAAIVLAAATEAAVLAAPAAAQSPDSSPVGLWRQVDEQTGRAQGLVRIVMRDGALYGRIERVFNPADAGGVCEQCTDDRKGKPIIGLELLRGLRPDGDGSWSGGDILDPGTGKVYSASLRLADGGQKLIVRGYLLISLLGRSQTWVRDQ
jgi:uncharacterized protein (DUF2147 family)